MPDLGEKIKRIRLRLKESDKKWTQGYVASKVGVARVTYTAYENGTKSPPPDMVKKLANLYGVTTDYLLGNEEKNEILDDPLTSIMFKDWEKMNEEQRKEALNIIKYIISKDKDIK